MRVHAIIIASTLYALSAGAQTTALINLTEKNKAADQPVTNISTEKLNPVSDFMKYVKEAQDELAGNEKRIAALKARLSGNNKDHAIPERIIKKREKNILILEGYNNELKADLNNYLNLGTGNWLLFKKEFNRDLTELGRYITELKHEYEDFIAEVIK